ncbi:FliA/WhiG family RNA polymerase sigma factor [Desulfococcus sp.]|uniref:FliA/WhiG family RNA polymerase sigma factor n=1 Tax=Desulfococcus sp. TaxID=2025834 RepID=UPI0035938D10
MREKMTNRYPTSQVSHGDADAGLSRETLILKYTPYVKRMVGRIAAQVPRDVDRDDLINAGIIGLIEALDRYDASRDSAFITFATFRIRGAVLSELRARDVCSRSARRRLRDMKEAFLKLETELGRPPEEAEVAAAMGIDMDEYHGIRHRAAISVVSFEDLGFDAKGERRRMIDDLMDADAMDGLALAGLKELTLALAQAVRELPEKDKLVISLYYQDELTMKEIGRVLDISESRVSQLHARAVITLRERLTAAGLIEAGRHAGASTSSPGPSTFRHPAAAQVK